MNITLNKLALGSALMCILCSGGCNDTPEVSPEELDRICKDHCPPPNPLKETLVKVLMDQRMDDDGVLKPSPHSQLYVKTPDGKLKVANKSEGLDERCFSTKPYESPHLRDVNLTEKNTTITFINFGKDGRVESRKLTANGVSSKLALDKINLVLNPLQSPGTTSDYEHIQEYLSEIVRPGSNVLTAEGFEPRDLDPIDDEKTPYHEPFDLVQPDIGSPHGMVDHVFFYVLLDSNLKFNRDTAAMIPYPPSVGRLETPYIQYPIFTASSVSDPLEVMTVYFHRGGTMTNDLNNDMYCSYPYDIGVVAAGQSGHMEDTPLLIDPEVRPKGVLP